MKSYADNWGGYPSSHPLLVRDLELQGDTIKDIEEVFSSSQGTTCLPRGLGRSYGDVCLNNDGVLLNTSAIRGIIQFDAESGRLRTYAGTSLDEILTHTIPAGWIVPVLPGTRFVSVGGAIANDIHGKNHHNAGSFGNHIRFIVLWHKGALVSCSPDQTPELFAATIGGMGLTGLIVVAEIQLVRIQSSSLTVTTTKISGLTSMVKGLQEADHDSTFTVGWFDVQRNRGHLQQANFLSNGKFTVSPLKPIRMPSAVKIFVNRPMLHLGNLCYFHQFYGNQKTVCADVKRFLFPLDVLYRWDSVYYPSGLLQYQFVVPFLGGTDSVEEVFAIIRQNKVMINLAVVKTFGTIEPVGMMSFPMAGITVAMDMKNSPHVQSVLAQCDRIVAEAGGRVYLAKDSRLSAESFRAMYSQARSTFEHYRDPLFSSSLWRRLTV